jgi:hypothetical protein
MLIILLVVSKVMFGMAPKVADCLHSVVRQPVSVQSETDNDVLFHVSKEAGAAAGNSPLITFLMARSYFKMISSSR